jgi:hypothetical protein
MRSNGASQSVQCLAQSSDAIPRVVLLGRLCLYGPGAARLHEELIPITARWQEPSRRKSPLKPYASEAESKTMDLLEDALLPSKIRNVTDVIMKNLQTSGPQDVEELLPHLEERGTQLAEDAITNLQGRGEKEAKAMVEILTNQKSRVEKTVERYKDHDPQLEFKFDANEVKQLAANQRHWTKRLEAIDRELESEPKRIRELYQVNARRIEPTSCSTHSRTCSLRRYHSNAVIRQAPLGSASTPLRKDMEFFYTLVPQMRRAF